MRNLPVQIRRLDRVPIHETEGPDAGAGEVCRGGAAQTPGADEEDFCFTKTFLSFLDHQLSSASKVK